MALGGGVVVGIKSSKRAKVPEAAAGDNGAAPLPPELSALQRAFKERALEEASRHREAVDSEFWVAICFETREQKEEFLRQTALDLLGDKYLDGREAADVLGVELTKHGRKSKIGRVDAKYAAMAKR